MGEKVVAPAAVEQVVAPAAAEKAVAPVAEKVVEPAAPKSAEVVVSPEDAQHVGDVKKVKEGAEAISKEKEPVPSQVGAGVKDDQANVAGKDVEAPTHPSSSGPVADVQVRAPSTEKSEEAVRIDSVIESTTVPEVPGLKRGRTSKAL